MRQERITFIESGERIHVYNALPTSLDKSGIGKEFPHRVQVLAETGSSYQGSIIDLLIYPKNRVVKQNIVNNSNLNRLESHIYEDLTIVMTKHDGLQVSFLAYGGPKAVYSVRFFY